MSTHHIFNKWILCVTEKHIPKGIKLKSFQYEMIAIFTEIIVNDNQFNTVVSGVMKHK